MSTIHPSWESTDGGQGTRSPQPVAPARTPARTAHVPIAVSRGSPRPAAVVGILIAIGVGFGISQNLSLFTGQVGVQREVLITITKGGFRPVNSSTQPGGKIRWSNTDTVEHVIGAEKLLTVSGAFVPITIAPGAEATVTISPDIAAGTYVYTAQDESQFQGVLRVLRPAPTSSEGSATSVDAAAEGTEISSEGDPGEAGESGDAPSSAPSFSEILNRRVRELQSSMGSSSSDQEDAGGEDDEATRGSAPDGGAIFTLDGEGDDDDDDDVNFEDDVEGGTIERNPHTVGSAPNPPPPSYRPAAAGSAPITQTFVPQADVAGAQVETFRPGAPRQPSSGPEMWILGIASIGLFLVFTRKALASD